MKNLIYRPALVCLYYLITLLEEISEIKARIKTSIEALSPPKVVKNKGVPKVKSKGYIGYEAGGQLTNAVKKNPFFILLFYKIEKAHPSIFDKFLQILEYGRMTDGQGNTVYFSESIIIFTSNLGIFTSNEFGARETNITIDMPYEEMSAKIRQAIENYFKINLGRPKILNRIGENIVVYDYIRPES